MASVMSESRSRSWAAVRPGFAVRSAAFVSPMRVTEMIRATVMTAAAAYMSLTAFSTGAGAGARGGSAGLFMSVPFWVPGRLHPLSATGAR